MNRLSDGIVYRSKPVGHNKEMSHYVLAFDQGTTSSRSLLIDHDAKIVASAQREFNQIFPSSGWVEHDPADILASQLWTAEEVLAKAKVLPTDIVSLGITNQRETVVVWDRETGRPVYNAIVWQDRRTAKFCDRLKNDGAEGVVREKTGLVIDPYFSATKVRWILDNVAGARDRADQGKLAFGTVDSWLVWNLTGGGRHVTDRTNASRTMLYDIVRGEWDDVLLQLFGVPSSMLPEVVWSSERIGDVAEPSPLTGIQISGIAGDQQAALFGQLCVKPGDAKNTYGTGCFLLQNAGDEFTLSPEKLITTLACSIDRRLQYALEGSVFIGGAVVQWLRDKMHFIDRASDIEQVASSVDSSGNVIFVPAFTGLGAPHWDPYASGMIIGLERGTEIGHIARAALESIAFQVTDVLRAMGSDLKYSLTTLKVDGGASANDLLMQFQADLLQIPVERPTVLETTALGAAFLAGLSTGYWKSIDEIAQTIETPRTFMPSIDSDLAREKYARWQNAVGRSREWSKDSIEA